MKKDIHPEYREVLFHDASADKFFLIRSTLETTQTKEWEDGKTYPYYPLDISSASHPFYTGNLKAFLQFREVPCLKPNTGFTIWTHSYFNLQRILASAITDWPMR